MHHGDRWFGVELRHLAAVSAVAREGSFRKAADSLGYVQSAVSQQVAELESRIGMRLIQRERGSKQIEVTPLGELLVEHANQILARVDAARADLTFKSQSNGSHERVLRVGVFPSVTTRLLPGVLQGMATGSPAVRVDVVERGSETALVELVEQGEVDVAFGELPLAKGAFRSRAMLRDPCVLLVASGSEWAQRPKPPTVAELATAPLFALKGARSTGALEAWFAAQGFTVQVAQSAVNEVTLRAFTAAGLGVAIVPRLAVEPWDPRLVAIDLTGVVPERQIALFWHSERVYGDELERFCESAMRSARQLVDQYAERSPGNGSPGPA